MDDGRVLVGVGLAALVAVARTGSRGVVRGGATPKPEKSLRVRLLPELNIWIDTIQHHRYRNKGVYPSDELRQMRALLVKLERNEAFDPWVVGQQCMTWAGRLLGAYEFPAGSEPARSMMTWGRDLEQRTMDEGSRGVVRKSRPEDSSGHIKFISGRAGDLAFLDTFSGMVPCKVESIKGTEIIVRLTATRGAYRKGMFERSSSRWVIPRPAVYQRSYKQYILPYRWEEGSLGVVRGARLPAKPVLQEMLYIDGPKGHFVIALTDSVATTCGLWFWWEEGEGWSHDPLPPGEGYFCGKSGTDVPDVHYGAQVAWRMNNAGSPWTLFSGRRISLEQFVSDLDDHARRIFNDWMKDELAVMLQGSRGLVRSGRVQEQDDPDERVFVIAEMPEPDQEPLFWNNEGGFEDLSSAIRYTVMDPEINLPFNGVWETVADAKDRVAYWRKVWG